MSFILLLISIYCCFYKPEIFVIRPPDLFLLLGWLTFVATWFVLAGCGFLLVGAAPVITTLVFLGLFLAVACKVLFNPLCFFVVILKTTTCHILQTSVVVNISYFYVNIDFCLVPDFFDFFCLELLKDIMSSSSSVVSSPNKYFVVK